VGVHFGDGIAVFVAAVVKETQLDTFSDPGEEGEVGSSTVKSGPEGIWAARPNLHDTNL
jgi:hypothetical protein